MRRTVYAQTQLHLTFLLCFYRLAFLRHKNVFNLRQQDGTNPPTLIILLYLKVKRGVQLYWNEIDVFVLIYALFSLAGLLLKLQELISQVPIPDKDEGFTKPGPYIYEMLKTLDITHDTAFQLIGTLEEAAVLLDEEKQPTVTNGASNLGILVDMLKLIFRENGSNHAEDYRVNFFIFHFGFYKLSLALFHLLKTPPQLFISFTFILC